MNRIAFHLRAALAAAPLLLAVLPSAQAADAMPPNAYYDMCLKAVDFPKPFGEWDLKGNAKLPAYCNCFSPLFAARATKAMKFMEKNPGKQVPGTIEESNAEELALRNTCRKQVGLPLAIDDEAVAVPVKGKPAAK